MDALGGSQRGAGARQSSNRPLATATARRSSALLRRRQRPRAGVRHRGRLAMLHRPRARGDRRGASEPTATSSTHCVRTSCRAGTRSGSASEQERFRQLRLHALEATSDQMLAEGSTFDALCAGLAAVSCEPLRESAHRCVIAAHLAEGNTSEATRTVRPLRRTAHCRRPASAGVRRGSGALFAESMGHRPPGTSAGVTGVRRLAT